MCGGRLRVRGNAKRAEALPGRHRSNSQRMPDAFTVQCSSGSVREALRLVCPEVLLRAKSFHPHPQMSAAYPRPRLRVAFWFCRAVERRRIGFENNKNSVMKIISFCTALKVSGVQILYNCRNEFSDIFQGLLLFIFNPFLQVCPILFSVRFSFLPVLFVWDGWRRRTFFPLGTTRRDLCRDCRIL